MVPFHAPLRKRWQSGIATTARTSRVCPRQPLTRLLAATLHTLMSLSSEPLMMCWPSGVAATEFTTSLCPLKAWTSVPSSRYSRTSCDAAADREVLASGIA